VKKFKYIISGQGKEEIIWACAACKKVHMEEILLGKWKLIGMSDNEDLPCSECGLDQKVMTKANADQHQHMGRERPLD